MMFKKVLCAFSIFLPWKMKRWVLTKLVGYEIHPTSRIGFAWVFPLHLIMEPYSSIGHLTVCKGLTLLCLKQHAIIGRANWITSFPVNDRAHFAHQEDRNPQLVLGEHAAITNRHLIDCTNSVSIGRFSTFAGFRSQVLTHSIDVKESRQTSAPIEIGEYCFVGSGCVLLKGSVLPSFSVLGAMSLLNKRFSESYCLYAGVPARWVKQLSKDDKYFCRLLGYVH